MRQGNNHPLYSILVLPSFRILYSTLSPSRTLHPTMRQAFHLTVQTVSGNLPVHPQSETVLLQFRPPCRLPDKTKRLRAVLPRLLQCCKDSRYSLQYQKSLAFLFHPPQALFQSAVCKWSVKRSGAAKSRRKAHLHGFLHSAYQYSTKVLNDRCYHS